MAYSHNTHVGAYAIVKAPRIVTEYKQWGCPTHGDSAMQRGGDFCCRCGQPLTDLPRSELRRPRLIDLLPGNDDDLFSPVDVEGLADDEFVVIGNRSSAGEMHEGDIVEITSADIDGCMTDFAHAYSAGLSHLEKVATSVTIKFGVITFYK